MGFIDFTNGEVLTADQMDTVMRQSVMKFADAATRDTALSAVLAEGMMCYLDDTNEVLKYDGSSWIDISGDITGVTAGTALTGGGTSGNVTLDVDETALTIAQSQVTDLTTDLAGKQDDVITTQGDLVIGDASGDPVRLPVGSADQVLTSDGTTVSFQDAGGGSGDWTQIVTNQSVGTGTSFQLTGLSGFSDYVVLISNISTNDISSVTVTDINGEANGGMIKGARFNTNYGANSSPNVNQPGSIQLFREVSVNCDATIIFEGAGSTAPSKCEWLGGSNSGSSTNEQMFFGNSMINKNSLPLDTITISNSSGSFTGGAIDVYAR